MDISCMQSPTDGEQCARMVEQFFDKMQWFRPPAGVYIVPSYYYWAGPKFAEEHEQYVEALLSCDLLDQADILCSMAYTVVATMVNSGSSPVLRHLSWSDGDDTISRSELLRRMSEARDRMLTVGRNPYAASTHGLYALRVIGDGAAACGVNMALAFAEFHRLNMAWRSAPGSTPLWS